MVDGQAIEYNELLINPYLRIILIKGLAVYFEGGGGKTGGLEKWGNTH